MNILYQLRRNKNSNKYPSYKIRLYRVPPVPVSTKHLPVFGDFSLFFHPDVRDILGLYFDTFRYDHGFAAQAFSKLVRGFEP